MVLNQTELYCETTGEGGNGEGWGRFQRCDCPCEDMVQIEKPSAFIMTLGYFAQSIVVVIVGINMGLRLQQLQTPFPSSECISILMQSLHCSLKLYTYAYEQERLLEPMESICQSSILIMLSSQCDSFSSPSAQSSDVIPLDSLAYVPVEENESDVSR
jgi:hypothetical protein